MRSEEQKLAFALKCKEIEKEGGDVLGYIQMNWPSYTPRATWYNLQGRYLKRNESQLTEGRPKTKGDDETLANGKMLKLACAVMACEKDGGDLRALLADMGYKDASAALGNAKQYCRLYRKDLYPEIQNIKLPPLPVRVRRKPMEQPPAPGNERPQVQEEKCEETPLRSEPLSVHLKTYAVQGLAGRYELTEMGEAKFMSLVVKHQLTGTVSEVTFAASVWKHMLKEIPEAMKALGLN